MGDPAPAIPTFNELYEQIVDPMRRLVGSDRSVRQLIESFSSANERPFVAKLRAFLAQENLEATYLKANPHFAEEQLAFSVLQARGANPMDELGGFDAFLQEENAIYMVPDAVHGAPLIALGAA